MNNPDLGQVFTSSVIADYMVSLFTLSKEASILENCTTSLIRIAVA